jgi:hypothetical protein
MNIDDACTELRGLLALRSLLTGAQAEALELLISDARATQCARCTERAVAPPSEKILDTEFQIARTGNTIAIDLWYPRVGTNAKHIEVGLCDVRAADSIRIHYDFARDGYVIEQASAFSWEIDDEVRDPDWKEAAFIKAWARRTDEDGT